MNKPPEERETSGQAVLDRCNLLIADYLDLEQKNHRRSNQAQGAALVFTAVIPIVLLLPWAYVYIVAPFSPR